MRKTLTPVLLFSVIFILFVLLRRENFSKAEPDEPVLKIGILLNLSGDDAKAGNEIKNFAIYANKKFDTDDSVVRHKMFVEDAAGSDENGSISGVEKLINTDKVNVIITTSTKDAKDVSPKAFEKIILHIGLADNPAKEGNLTTFTNWTTPHKKAKKLLEILKKDGVKSVAALVQTDDTMEAMFDELEIECEKNGIYIDKFSFSKDQKNLHVDLMKIKQGSYDKMVLLMFYPLVDILGKQMQYMDIKVPMTAIDSFMYSRNKEVFEDNLFVNSLITQSPLVVSIQENIRAKGNQTFAQIYDTLDIINIAASEFYAKHKRIPNGWEMTQAILAMEKYEGVAGELVIDKERTIHNEASVLVIKDGKLEIVE